MRSRNDRQINVHGARMQLNCTDQRCSQPHLTANLKILSRMRRSVRATEDPVGERKASGMLQFGKDAQLGCARRTCRP